MGLPEPRVRRRGYIFLNGGEHDPGEHENPEGVGSQIRIARHTPPRSRAGLRARSSAARSTRSSAFPRASTTTRTVHGGIKSAIATGSHRLSR